MIKNVKASLSVRKIAVIAILLVILCGVGVMATNVNLNNVKIVLSNNSSRSVQMVYTISLDEKEANFVMPDGTSLPAIYPNSVITLEAGKETGIIAKIKALKEIKDAPVVNIDGEYLESNDVQDLTATEEIKTFSYENVISEEESSKKDAIVNFLKQTGFSMTNWKQLVMILVACVLLYLAIVKKFEPLLLLPIAFGMLLTNLAGAEMFHDAIFINESPAIARRNSVVII